MLFALAISISDRWVMFSSFKACWAVNNLI